jgi:hypothetical protein
VAAKPLPCGVPDTFAIYAPHRKRAHIAGEIDAAARAIAKQRETLATPDAVIWLFEPESNPEQIPAIRPASRRCVFFQHREVTRLCLAALRDAAKPVPRRYVDEYAIQAKGLDVDRRVGERITEQVRRTPARLESV